MTVDQEAQIKRQVKEARASVDLEVEEFKQQQLAEEAGREAEPIEHADGQNGTVEELKPVGSEPPQEAKESNVQTNDQSTNVVEPTNGDMEVDTRADSEKAAEAESKDTADDNQGEMIVEAEEDTVIYWSYYFELAEFAFALDTLYM